MYSELTWWLTRWRELRISDLPCVSWWDIPSESASLRTGELMVEITSKHLSWDEMSQLKQAGRKQTGTFSLPPPFVPSRSPWMAWCLSTWRVPSTDSHIDLGQKHPHRYTHDHVQPRHPVASQADTQNEPSLVTKRTSLSVHLRLCHGAVRDAGEMTNVLVWLHFNYVFQLLMCLLSPSGCQFLGHNNANNSSNSCYLVIA